jgi:hypothetical protein
MKNDELQSRLRETGWRRKLTETERAEWRARLAADAGTQADWELEAALTAALARLPDTPVPSNFTARVLQAVEREEARPQRRGWRWNWHALVPRVAFAAVVITFSGLAFHHHVIYTQRTALARNVALVTAGQPMPSMEALENFDAIRRLGRPQHADDELLVLMQ